MNIIDRKVFVLLALLVSANCFQNSHQKISFPPATKICRETIKNNPEFPCNADSIRIRSTKINGPGRKDPTTAVLFSNKDSNAENTNNYNDDAFGFVLLIGYFLTQDVIFAGTFILLSAIAAIATRNGKLPATNSVPAAVAGLTYIVNLIIPNESLYELLPSLPPPEAALPVDVSLIELAICSVSILYGFVLSSSADE